MMIAMLVATADIGRVKKISKLPLETMSDCRRLNSRIGPRIKLRSNGAPSYPNFLKRYPMIPKIIIMSTSKMLLLMPKAPTMQKSKISGKRIL